MDKICHFSGVVDGEPRAIPLFNRATDRALEKVASHGLLPEVVRYIDTLRPRQDAIYVLDNALGASEWWSSNVNGDGFEEAGLIHKPEDWTGNPLLDAIRAKDWAYGFPTFYNAKPFAHHKNQDPNKGFGDVELAAWNDNMKRVDLVIRVDRARCLEHGGVSVWDKLSAGQYPDTSMGARVPFDLCFPAGTLVRTTDGNVPIERIEVGMRVRTHTGAVRRVQRLFARQSRHMTTITCGGLPELTATPNHPLLVLREEQTRTCKGTANGKRVRHSFLPGSSKCRRCGASPEYQMVWAAAGTVRPGDYVATPRLTPGATRSPASSVARTLGYYLGDGSIQQARRGRKRVGETYDQGLRFSVGSHEIAHLQRLLSTVREASGKAARVYPEPYGRNAFIVTLCDRELAANMRRLGGSGSRGKRLAEECFRWCDDAKMELVAGYIDTDGSFDKKSGAVRIGSVNRGLLLDVQRLLLSIGITASVCFAGTVSERNGYAPGTRSWYLSLSAAQAQHFHGRTHKVDKREIGYDSPSSFFWGDHWFAPVRTVHTEEVLTDVYNLSVEGDESYIAEGRAVHNCSICLDTDAYLKALSTYDEKRHKSPGAAALEVHKRLVAEGKGGIRGLAPTRKTYCVHAKSMMNKILPDGRKVFVRNPYPRFFDISFVFIGADRTSKVMMKIAGDRRVFYSFGSSAEAAEKLGFVDTENDDCSKVAAAQDLKVAGAKRAEIDKSVPASSVSFAVPRMSAVEKDLPNALLDTLGKSPLESMSTMAGLGMVLKPREFQRIVLVGRGQRQEADMLEHEGTVFPPTDECCPMGIGASLFSTSLAELLLPYMLSRSLLRPFVEPRCVLISARVTHDEPKKEQEVHSKTAGRTTSLPFLGLDKIGSAYNGYRAELSTMLPTIPDLLSQAGRTNQHFAKLASAGPEALFSYLSLGYARSAFLDSGATQSRM